MNEVEAKQLLEYIPQKERDSYDAADFAGPDRSFPITTQAQLDAAAHLIGHAADPEAVKRKAIAIAKRKGFTLPKAWQKDDDGKKEEAAAAVTSSVVKPKKKIGTLPICWLEYNARSLNGRIYPKATCDAIFKAAQRKLADTNALPATTFVSHEDANGNVNTNLVGGPTKVWQEGSKFWANIDLADTSVARDILGLVEGKYLRSGSMRVQGVELMHDRNYDLPLVVVQEGIEPEFMGIDLTTRPGLADIARIPRVLYESAGHAPYIDTFALDDVQIEALKGAPMPIPIYLKVVAEMQEAMTADRRAHQRIHDHLAGVLDATVKPIHGSESARLTAAVESELSEEGRAIAKQHAYRLAKAHDEAAHQMGMDCEGGYHSALGIPLDPDEDPDGDGIPDDLDPNDKKDDSMESAHAVNKPLGGNDMTPEQMMEALKKQGFTVAPPKTKEQELQEAFDAKLAEQERKFNEKLAALAESNPPQRKTQALNGAQESNPLTPEVMYEEGDLLNGTLNPKNWKALANPRVPWPADLDPELVLHELSPFVGFTILGAQEAARGRSLRDAIDAGIYS